MGYNEVILVLIRMSKVREVENVTLVCLVHNIKKIYATIMAKGGELDDLTGKLQAAYYPD